MLPSALPSSPDPFEDAMDSRLTENRLSVSSDTNNPPRGLLLWFASGAPSLLAPPTPPAAPLGLAPLLSPPTPNSVLTSTGRRREVGGKQRVREGSCEFRRRRGTQTECCSGRAALAVRSVQCDIDKRAAHGEKQKQAWAHAGTIPTIVTTAQTAFSAVRGARE
jgi:hypothetical protein